MAGVAPALFEPGNAGLHSPDMQGRKTVSILFCDVVDSTPLGEQLDPESLQRVMSRWFAEARAIVERHGGTVEKFIGDEVMAVFGVPVVHEDDALRACRAAVEVRNALPELGLRGRIGVNTGEVVTGTEERLATGDAVNVAARLEQAAEPGQLLLGPAAHRLTLGRIDVEDLGPVELKGLDRPIWAWRALGTSGSGGARPRTLHAPLLRRDTELELLSNT